MEYNLLKPWETLDPWQKEYIDTESNCFILCGRQSGKTAAMSIKFGKRAATRPNRVVLMVAYTERQAYNLFFKTLMYLREVYPKEIKRGVDKPTQHEIHLKNGSLIMCYACGLSGEGIRTYTVTDLVVDEAAPMSREVFIAITPMISVTKGTIDISSTPRGREGYFYECSKRDDFKKFYVSAEDCPRHSKEFLEEERKNMTRLEYAQEYLAIFLDELKSFFPSELIAQSMILQRSISQIPLPAEDSFLGVDVAAHGLDDTVLFSVNRINREKIKQIDMEITNNTKLSETVARILKADEKYNYKKIYIDDGGIGVGVFDPLLDNESTRRKVIAINNARRSLDNEGLERKKLMKEDLYTNLLRLMESGMVELFDEKEISLSLKSVQYEYENGKMKIYGRDTHIAEALVRAAWCMKDRTNSLWVR